MKTKTVIIKTTEENPEPVELIAKSIIEIADAFNKISQGPLSRWGLVVLIQAHTGLPKNDINAVLDCVNALKRIYIKDVPKPSK